MSTAEDMRDHIAAFWRDRGGGVIVELAARGYSLFSARTGALVARAQADRNR